MLNRTLITVAILSAATSSLFADEAPAFRPPSVPLVAHDPYFSIWSDGDHLTDDVTRHWTHEAMTLTGLVRVDGKPMRIIGTAPEDVPAMKQTSTKVTPTRTICTFESDAIRLTLTFLTPALPDDIELLSTPITYVIWDVTSADGKPHEVTAFFSAGADLARNDKSQEVKIAPTDKSSEKGSTAIIKLGTSEQPTLERKGDGVRIDWGYACLGGKTGVKLATGEGEQVIKDFLETGKIDTTETPAGKSPALGALITFGPVTPTIHVTRHILIGYDDDKSIEYMGEPLNGFWKHDGTTIEKAFDRFETDMAAIQKRCVEFDEKLTKSLTEVGGEKYAQLACLAYRQSFAGSKIVADDNGMPLFFPKENTSNGCIATADVFFPQIPLLLLLNNDLAKATVVPILDYAGGTRWKFPFAPHDLGTYPQANGQVYGGGEKNENDQMPVEESGNLLLIVGAISKIDGNTKFADKYWPELTKWASYLEHNGVDPANQLCTDDFAGHLARNANLSVKAILGMASYGMMAEMKGDSTTAKHYADFAKASAKKWMQMADAGDHYALAFGHNDTWSQKYNLVWDDVFDLHVFPPEVKTKELAFYKTKLNAFGLPLDSRKTFTKSDWLTWTATLNDDKASFEQFTDGLWKFANETNNRVPFSDWYETGDAKVVGFIARPVIGGLFMPMLKDDKVWMSWAHQPKSLGDNWAKMPVLPPPPKTVVVVPNSREQTQTWRYTFDKPADDWSSADFNDKSWKQGPGGFGTAGTPNAIVKTVWNTDDIWLRRTITIPANAVGGDFRLDAHHDEDLDVFIDGKPLARESGFTADYKILKLVKDGSSLLTPGKHVLAVHCLQTGGGQYVDVGIVKVVK